MRIAMSSVVLSGQTGKNKIFMTLVGHISWSNTTQKQLKIKTSKKKVSVALFSLQNTSIYSSHISSALVHHQSKEPQRSGIAQGSLEFKDLLFFKKKNVLEPHQSFPAKQRQSHR